MWERKNGGSVNFSAWQWAGSRAGWAGGWGGPWGESRKWNDECAAEDETVGTTYMETNKHTQWIVAHYWQSFFFLAPNEVFLSRFITISSFLSRFITISSFSYWPVPVVSQSYLFHLLFQIVEVPLPILLGLVQGLHGYLPYHCYSNILQQHLGNVAHCIAGCLSCDLSISEREVAKWSCHYGYLTTAQYHLITVSANG